MTGSLSHNRAIGSNPIHSNYPALDMQSDMPLYLVKADTGSTRLPYQILVDPNKMYVIISGAIDPPQFLPEKQSQAHLLVPDNKSTMKNPSYSQGARDCLERLYYESLHESNAKALGYIFESIEKAFSENDLPFVNELLLNFDPDRTKSIVSTGLLRVTFRARTKLSEWMPCVARVWEFLAQQGENPKHVLRGLVQTDDSNAFTTTTTIF